MSNSETFTHLDAAGSPRMVDIANKAVTQRAATVQARIVFPPQVVEALSADD